MVESTRKTGFKEINNYLHTTLLVLETTCVTSNFVAHRSPNITLTNNQTTKTRSYTFPTLKYDNDIQVYYPKTYGHLCQRNINGSIRVKKINTIQNVAYSFGFNCKKSNVVEKYIMHIYNLMNKKQLIDVIPRLASSMPHS